MPKRKELDPNFKLAQQMYENGDFLVHNKKQKKVDFFTIQNGQIAGAATAKKKKKKKKPVRARSTPPRLSGSHRKSTRESPRGKKLESSEEGMTDEDHHDDEKSVVSLPKQQDGTTTTTTTVQQQFMEVADIDMGTLDKEEEEEETVTLNHHPVEPQLEVAVLPPQRPEGLVHRNIQEHHDPEDILPSAHKLPPRVPKNPPRAHPKKKHEAGDAAVIVLPQPTSRSLFRDEYSGLDTIQESLLQEQVQEPEPPLAPTIVPHEYNDDEEEETMIAPTQYPKSFKLEFYLMVISILMAFVSLGAATYFAVFDATLPNDVSLVTSSSSVSSSSVSSDTDSCPPGGRCVDGVLSECLPYLVAVEGVCVLDDSAALNIKMIDSLLHKYSFDHIRSTKQRDENPYFAREEQGRPLYYLASVAKALEIQADAALLYAANILEDTFVLSGGFLVGVHPHKAIRGSFYAHAQVLFHTVVSTIAFFVWSVLVTIFAIYSSWFQQAKIMTSLATIVGIFVLLVAHRIYIKRRAQNEKEQRVLLFRKMAYAELYQTHGSIDAEVLFARVLAKAFPSNRTKREHVKKDVWRHILKDAENDIRIHTKIVQGKTFWEWTDMAAPTM